ncbi:MAG: hypothetical protein Q9227_006504 [Pyrenula ochraceoflavens]
MLLRQSFRKLSTLPAFSLEGKTNRVYLSCHRAVTFEINETFSAGRGLGKEFLTAFALSGARGVCVDLTLPIAEASIKHITSHIKKTTGADPELHAYGCDATVESDVKRTWKNIEEDVGEVHCLVTAAGIVDNVEAENYEFARWRKMMDINVDGSWLFAREAGSHMLRSQIRGSIILIASMSGSICVRPQKQAAYNTSKSAIKMLAKSLATEWGPHGIRVNSLSPGYVLTDLLKELLEKEGKALTENWIKDIPLGRLAHPSELQGAIVWMASDASTYLNGSDVVRRHYYLKMNNV